MPSRNAAARRRLFGGTCRAGQDRLMEISPAFLLATLALTAAIA